MSFSVFDYLKVRYNPDSFRHQIFLGNLLQPVSLNPINSFRTCIFSFYFSILADFLIKL